jgi:MYND finger
MKAAGGYLNIVTLLIQSGADPNKESQKRLPSDFAKESGFDEVVELLKEPYICANCAKKVPQKELKRCGKCKIVKYCSGDCQKKHWLKFHRRQCTIWAERKDELSNRDKK